MLLSDFHGIDAETVTFCCVCVSTTTWPRCRSSIQSRKHRRLPPLRGRYRQRDQASWTRSAKVRAAYEGYFPASSIGGDDHALAARYRCFAFDAATMWSKRYADILPRTRGRSRRKGRWRHESDAQALQLRDIHLPRASVSVATRAGLVDPRRRIVLLLSFGRHGGPSDAFASPATRAGASDACTAGGPACDERSPEGLARISVMLRRLALRVSRDNSPR